MPFSLIIYSSALSSLTVIFTKSAENKILSHLPLPSSSRRLFLEEDLAQDIVFVPSPWSLSVHLLPVQLSPVHLSIYLSTHSSVLLQKAFATAYRVPTERGENGTETRSQGQDASPRGRC